MSAATRKKLLKHIKERYREARTCSCFSSWETGGLH